MSVPNLKRISLFIHYKGVRKFRNLVTWPRPRPLWGGVMIHTQ